MPCEHPFLIPNPNYRRPVSGPYDAVKDHSHKMIYVPCGVCSSCLKIRQMYFVQRVQMESLTNHLFMCMLSYSSSGLPRFSLSNGRSVAYADISHVQKMMKRLRKSDPLGRPIRYMAVSELGDEKGRPHFHLIFSVPRKDGDTFQDISILENTLYWAVRNEWRENVGSRRSPVWKPLFEYHERMRHGRLERNYDLHYVHPYLGDKSVLSPAFYTSKYILKFSKRVKRLHSALKLNLPSDEFSKVWSVVRPRLIKSLDFGQSRNFAVRSYIRKGIQSSLAAGYKYPCFINEDTGQYFPLSRFYKSKLYDLPTALKFKENSGVVSPDLPQETDHVSLDDHKRRVFQFSSLCDKVESSEHDFSF